MLAETVSTVATTEERLDALQREVEGLKQALEPDKQDSTAIVCFSGEWDKLYAAFTIANGALAMGQEVHMFFTFWGATAIRKARSEEHTDRSLVQRFMSWALPRRASRTPLSRMNFGGFGKVMFEGLLKDQGVDDLATLIDQAKELGAQFHCCETSLRLLGWDKSELLEEEDTHWCGVPTFLSLAKHSRTTLFI